MSSHIPSETCQEEDMYFLPGNGGVFLGRRAAVTWCFSILCTSLAPLKVAPEIALVVSMFQKMLLHLTQQHELTTYAPPLGGKGCFGPAG